MSRWAQMLHYFNILGKMFYSLASPTWCLSSWSSVHWIFRKFPFKSLKKKKSVHRLDFTSSCCKVSILCSIQLVCKSAGDKKIFVSRAGGKEYWVSVSHVSKTRHCITSLKISFHLFSYLYSRLVFTFEALRGKVSSRQKILKAFECMFFPCRSL